MGKTYKLDVNHLNHCIVVKNTVKILNKTCFVHKYLNPAEFKKIFLSEHVGLRGRIVIRSVVLEKLL